MPVTFTDIIVHFAMFLAFSFALFLDLTRKRAGYQPMKFIIIAIALSFGLSCLTELLQYLLVPLNRTGSLSDLAADFGGSVVGTLMAAFIKRKFSAVS